MKRKLFAMLVSAVVILGGSAAMAGPFPADVAGSDGTPTALQAGGHPEQYEAVNRLLETSYAANSGIDGLFVEPEPLWRNLSGTIAVIGLSAGNTNTLGVYTDASGNSRTHVTDGLAGFGFLGDGTYSNPYPAYAMNIPIDTTFGWYLQSNSAYYFSNSGLNPGGWDHLMVFDMSGLANKTIYIKNGVTKPYTFTNPYLLCWEDQNMGDKDYNDMIYLVDKVAPVPEPATMLLLGLGLMGLAGVRRKLP